MDLLRLGIYLRTWAAFASHVSSRRPVVLGSHQSRAAWVVFQTRKGIRYGRRPQGGRATESDKLWGDDLSHWGQSLSFPEEAALESELHGTIGMDQNWSKPGALVHHVA